MSGSEFPKHQASPCGKISIDSWTVWGIMKRSKYQLFTDKLEILPAMICIVFGMFCIGCKQLVGTLVKKTVIIMMNNASGWVTLAKDAAVSVSVVVPRD